MSTRVPCILSGYIGKLQAKDILGDLRANLEEWPEDMSLNNQRDNSIQNHGYGSNRRCSPFT